MNIEIKNISKAYKKKTVLEGLCLSCHGGECIGILGENGSGKSTLLSLLYGIEKGEGAFLCDGCDLMRDKAKRQALVGLVPQTPPLIDELNGIDNLRLWYSPKALKKELESGVLALLGIPEFAKTRVSKMSGGMKKRLSIGCGVADKPKILLLDEPSSALDLPCKAKIAEYIKDFTDKGGVVIIATHDAAELELCHRLYILKDKKLEEYSGQRSIAALTECLV